jgi:glycosyltransferase involved in cell wall biosynthesis
MNPSAQGNSILISVIVPARNEEKVLGDCLKSLESQTLPAGAYEVIVVDNGSTDGTVETAHRFETSFPLLVLEKKGVTISAVRKRAPEGNAWPLSTPIARLRVTGWSKP